jgi:hypothetical protein
MYGYSGRNPLAKPNAMRSVETNHVYHCRERGTLVYIC